MTPIMLSDFIKVENPKLYKLHLACGDGSAHPLDEYVENRNNWIAWNRWRSSKDDWNRDFIFSFIEYIPVSDGWLFGGIFKVLQRYPVGPSGNNPEGYDLELVDDFEKFEGRLICKFHRYKGLRGRAYKLENFIDSFEIFNILSEKYDGEGFKRYEEVNHKLSFLRAIVKREKQDWKVPLSAVKGIYLIMDTNNGLRYVGSAYGEAGIWSRISCYVNTGHGWNDDLIHKIKEKGLDYALSNFKFSILEIFPFCTPDDVILSRESHWKDVMLSREFGYNRN